MYLIRFLINLFVLFFWLVKNGKCVLVDIDGIFWVFGSFLVEGVYIFGLRLKLFLENRIWCKIMLCENFIFLFLWRNDLCNCVGMSFISWLNFLFRNWLILL